LLEGFFVTALFFAAFFVALECFVAVAMQDSDAPSPLPRILRFARSKIAPRNICNPLI